MAGIEEKQFILSQALDPHVIIEKGSEKNGFNKE